MIEHSPPNVRWVTEPDDPALSDFWDLTDVAARSVTEPEAGLFIAEGAKVITRALTAGLSPRRILCTPKFYGDQLAQALEDSGHADVPVLLVTPELARAVTGFRVHRGALAAFCRPVATDARAILHRIGQQSSGALLALIDLVDHTNVGAIFRNAAALGIGGVLVSARCADPLYRRSIKVSMGAVFAVPWATLSCDVIDPIQLLRQNGIATVALTPDRSAVDISAVIVPRPLAILIGTEGAGLPEALLDAADFQVRIPMSAGVDSLNVAAATAIACHRFGVPDTVSPSG